MRDDAAYLRHIAECIDLVEHYVAGIDGTPNEALFYEDLRIDRVWEAIVGALPALKAVVDGELSD